MGKKEIVGECDSCHYHTTLEEYESQLIPKGKPKLLCFLCANTAAGTAIDYPNFYPDKNTMRTVCFVGNVILDAIKGMK